LVGVVGVILVVELLLSLVLFASMFGFAGLFACFRGMKGGEGGGDALGSVVDLGGESSEEKIK
jgi:hypothetical protein